MSDKTEQQQAWRVVLSDGSVRDVVPRWERDSWIAETDRWAVRNGDPLWCVAEFARAVFCEFPVEILAPGEPTREELRVALRECAADLRRWAEFGATEQPHYEGALVRVEAALRGEVA